jgi:hypothetical protein
MKNRYLVGAVLVVGIMTLSAASVFAATQTNNVRGVGQGQFANLTQEERTAKMEEMRADHEAIQQAAINGDYATWAKLVAEMPMGNERLGVITADNFAEFSKAHKLMAESDAIMTDLGLEKGPGKGEFGKGLSGGMGRGMGKGCLQNAVTAD